ncbi:DUF4443 domain-containing protein [Candidatus Undinarchaeota archaeon]
MISTLKNLVDIRASYSEVHVIHSFLLLSEKPLGRFSLMEQLGLNEASVKTLLKKLVEAGFAESSTKGAVLTKKGEDFVDGLLGHISKPAKLKIEKLVVDTHNTAIVVKNSSKKVGNCIHLRDAAIRAGATGLTVLLKDGERLALPNCDFPIDYAKEAIESVLTLDDGDAILIGSAPTYLKSKQGAIAAALELLDSTA